MVWYATVFCGLLQHFFLTYGDLWADPKLLLGNSYRNTLATKKGKNCKGGYCLLILVQSLFKCEHCMCLYAFITGRYENVRNMLRTQSQTKSVKYITEEFCQTTNKCQSPLYFAHRSGHKNIVDLFKYFLICACGMQNRYGKLYGIRKLRQKSKIKIYVKMKVLVYSVLCQSTSCI